MQDPTLLALSALEDVVRSMPELSNEYEVVVDKRGDVDHILLKVDPARESCGDVKVIKEELKTELRIKTNPGTEREFYPYQSLPRYEVKAGRFKDLRQC
jgi:phenylacetate-CoA ligase